MLKNYIFLSIIVAVVKETHGTGLYTRVDGDHKHSIVFSKYPEHLSDGNVVEIDQELAKCHGVNILEISISEVQILFEKERLSALELTQCYLERIKRMETYLHSVVEINPDAQKIAEEMDWERRNGKVRGPLHGIPILVKENIATTDKMQTTAGSLGLLGLKPKHEAAVIKRLRRAGAVILGKSNLSEFAYFRGTNVPNGWSSRGNQTFCPYVLSKDPEGSSTGSAVATAANLAVFALGTDTDGSIIAPAHYQSLVGLRPTVGGVSTTGVIPISFTQDTVGPITRSVKDAVLVMNVISESGTQFYLNSKKNYRIGVFRDPFWKNNEQSPILEKALIALKHSSLITLVDPIETKPGVLDEITPEKEIVVFSHEFKVGINKYLGETEDDYLLLNNNHRRVSNLADIIAFNIAHPAKEGYNQNLLLGAQATDGLKNKTYIRNRHENMMTARAVFASVLNHYRLDAIVTPTIQENPKNISDLPFSLAAIAGYPTITVPAGFTSNHMPFGILFMGKANSENTLLNIASIMEEKLHARRPPRFLP